MGTKRFLMIIGTRPEAIKMAPLVKALQEHSAFEVTVCLTGQHTDLAKDALTQLGVSWDAEWGICDCKSDLCQRTARTVAAAQREIQQTRPHLVLVHGDTVSALAAGMAAFYQRVPVGHVEAGLRTYRYDSPFPEEFCRCAIDALSAWHFAPTEEARQRLLQEGRDPQRVFVTGNTGLDAVRMTVQPAYSHPILAWAGAHPLAILTVHRRENWEKLEQIFAAVRQLCQAEPMLRILFPVHPNPQIRAAAERAFAECGNVLLSAPLDVRTFQNLLARCRFVLTDSGGLQEEAAFLGRPVLVLREDTERAEGGARLIGTSPQGICQACRQVLAQTAPPVAPQFCETPYGDGFAAQRIVALLQAQVSEKTV